MVIAVKCNIKLCKQCVTLALASMVRRKLVQEVVSNDNFVNVGGLHCGNWSKKSLAMIILRNWSKKSLAMIILSMLQGCTVKTGPRSH